MTDEQTTVTESEEPGATGENQSAAATGESSTPPEGENAGTKEGAQGENAGGVPEEYAEFSLPEGMTADEGLLAEVLPVFKAAGLTQEKAQELVDRYTQSIEAIPEAQAEKFEQLKDDWKATALKDDEIGGEAFEKNVGVAVRAVEKYATPELKELLESSGLGNHPEMIRLLYRVGNDLKEDSPVGGGTRAVTQSQDRASLLYPNS